MRARLVMLSLLGPIGSLVELLSMSVPLCVIGEDITRKTEWRS